MATSARSHSSRCSPSLTSEQCENLPAKIVDPNAAARVINSDMRDSTIDEFVTSTGTVVRHGELRAYYATAGDFINLPLFETFTNSHRYYETLAHELKLIGPAPRSGSTGHLASALATAHTQPRSLSPSLAAPLSARNSVLIGEEPSAAYLATWIECLEQNDGLLIAAAAAASRAVEFSVGVALEDDDRPEPLAMAA